MAQLNTKILLRSDTSENWANASVAGKGANAVLLKGEMGIELLNDGLTKIKIGDGTKTWAQLPYFSGEMPEIPSANVYEVGSYDELPTTGVAKGDTGIVKVCIFTDAEDESKNKYSYSGYVYNGNAWVAMDGNYNAENVILTGNVQLSGDYTKVGNIEKATAATVSTYDWDGMSVRQMFENILSKVLYPTKPAPYVSAFSLASTGSKEVGTTVTPTFTVKYHPNTYQFGSTENSTAGSYTYAAPTSGKVVTSDGNELALTFNSTGNGEATATVSDESFVVTTATSYYGNSTTIDYAQGAIPLTNTGAEYEASRVAAGSCSKDTDTGKITGYRNGCFYGTVSTDNFNPATDCTSAIIRGLSGKLGKNYTTGRVTNGTNDMTIPVGATAVLIACPADKTGPSEVVNTTVNAPMGTLSGAGNIVATISVNGAENRDPINYNVWAFVPAEAYGSAANLTIKLG